jgi:hypothetical protein
VYCSGILPNLTNNVNERECKKLGLIGPQELSNVNLILCHRNSQIFLLFTKEIDQLFDQILIYNELPIQINTQSEAALLLKKITQM